MALTLNDCRHSIDLNQVRLKNSFIDSRGNDRLFPVNEDHCLEYHTYFNEIATIFGIKRLKRENYVPDTPPDHLLQDILRIFVVHK